MSSTDQLGLHLHHRLQGQAKPCSLAEIGLGDSDEAALQRWARTVGEAHLGCRHFGLVFLALATVVARRRAEEHRLWPYVFEEFGSAGRTAFFDRNQQPKPEVRDSLTDAACTVRLRHVLDRAEGEQRWYLTILLQCGLTRPTLELLPEWLAGRRPFPRAVQLLLHDPILASRSFEHLLGALRALRSGEIRSFPPSIWLPGDLLLLAQQAARSRPELGVERGVADSPIQVELIDSRRTLPVFRIRCLVPGELVQGREPPHLDFELQGQVARALHQGERYYSLPTLELDLPRIASDGLELLRVCSPDGRRLLEENCTLFAGDDDLDLFVESGPATGEFVRATDPWLEVVPDRRAAYVRVMDDLELEGCYSAHPIRGQGSLWQRVRPEELDRARVALGEGLVWDIQLSRRLRRHWPGTISVLPQAEVWTPGTAVSWSCSLGSPAARVQLARLGRVSLEIREQRNGFCTLVLPATLVLPVSSLLKLVVLERGNRYVSCMPITPPSTRHLLVRRAEGLAPLRPVRWADLQEPVRFHCALPQGEEQEGDRPWLFEGPVPILPLSDRPVRLAHRLAGVGAPLTVRSRRFNAGNSLCKIEPPPNAGCVVGFQQREAGFASLQLDSSVDWDPGDSRVELMQADGTLGEALELEIRGPTLEFLCEGIPVAAAVCFREATVGRTTTPQLSETLIRLSASTAAGAESAVFQGLHWLYRHRFPIGQADLVAGLDALISKQPLEALALTLDPTFAQDEILSCLWGERLTQHRAELDCYLWEPERRRAALRRLLAELPATSGADRILQAYQRMARCQPLLAGRLLRASLAAIPSMPGPSFKWRGARDTVLRWAGSEPDAALEVLAVALGVDQMFLSKHLRIAEDLAVDGGEPLTTQRGNLRLLLQLAEFRRFLTRHVARRVAELAN